MSLNLNNLTPAPWDAIHGLREVKDIVGPKSHLFEPDFGTDADAEFAALARNAFEVMLRRSWGVRFIADSWTPVESGNGRMFWQRPQDGTICPVRGWPDPFTALVEADRWYRENAERTVTQ